jgi:hypothetical protein
MMTGDENLREEVKCLNILYRKKNTDSSSTSTTLGIWGGETDIVIFHFEPGKFYHKYLKKGLCTARTPRPKLVSNNRYLTF